jgi:hypothetical protein
LRRRHHYVPRFHLERFADDGAIFIFDRETGETRKSGTKAIAVKKDLYRIDVLDMQIDVPEIALSEIEGAASEVLRAIEKTHEMPKDLEDQRPPFCSIAL